MTPSLFQAQVLPAAWSRRAERRTCESWLDTEQALILGVKVAMSYLVNSMAGRLAQAIYMEEATAVFHLVGHAYGAGQQDSNMLSPSPYLAKDSEEG